MWYVCEIHSTPFNLLVSNPLVIKNRQKLVYGPKIHLRIGIKNTDNNSRIGIGNKVKEKADKILPFQIQYFMTFLHY